MNKVKEFQLEVKENIKNLGKDKKVKEQAIAFLNSSSKHNYSYNFSWMGRPIIQYPQDIIAMQELIWAIKPDLIIETGIAHGGSIIFSASMLELLKNNGKVIGIDIDIRKHNRKEIENHPMFKHIRMIEGSSISSEVIDTVKSFVKKAKKVLIFLDSNHTHDHVLKELELYSPFVTKGSYIVAFDSVVEFMDPHLLTEKAWSVGDNPFTAVKAFLKKNKNFVIDKEIENKLLITVAPSGYLKRVR